MITDITNIKDIRSELEKKLPTTSHQNYVVMTLVSALHRFTKMEIIIGYRKKIMTFYTYFEPEKNVHTENAKK